VRQFFVINFKIWKFSAISKKIFLILFYKKKKDYLKIHFLSTKFVKEDYCCFHTGFNIKFWLIKFSGDKILLCIMVAVFKGI